MANDSPKDAQQTLLSAAQKAAKADLHLICKEGMTQWPHHKFKFSKNDWKSWNEDPAENLFELMPQSLTSRPYFARTEGVFEGLQLNTILELCFEEAALKLIVEHSYNRYRFWSNVNAICWSLFEDPNEPDLPYTLAYVQQKLLADSSPFGVDTSPFAEAHKARLKAHIAAAGGKFDISKLEPHYAVFLMDRGLLLQGEKPDDFKEIPELLLSPRWTQFITDLSQTSA